MTSTRVASRQHPAAAKASCCDKGWWRKRCSSRSKACLHSRGDQYKLLVCGCRLTEPLTVPLNRTSPVVDATHMIVLMVPQGVTLDVAVVADLAKSEGAEVFETRAVPVPVTLSDHRTVHKLLVKTKQNEDSIDQHNLSGPGNIYGQGDKI